MLPTLREVLTLPSFVASSPELLNGDPDAVLVRWVHSSEVYEMGGLLAGGEVLLTTGLGLEGRSDRQLEVYMDRLADAGCAAVALEVGRSFLDVPAPLVMAARRRGLCLVALRDVVPFERMVEDFHELTSRHRPGSPRGGEALWQELVGLVVAEQPMTTLLSTTARLAACPVRLLDLDGQVVDRSAEVGRPDAGTDEFTVDVRSGARLVARLALRGKRTQRREAVAERAAVAVALALGRAVPADRPSLAQSLITDLVSRDLASRTEIAERCSAAGWPLTRDTHLLVAAADVDTRTRADAVVPAVREAVQSELGPCLVGTAGGAVLVLARGWHDPGRARARAAFDAAHHHLREGVNGQAVRTIAVADPVGDPADLGTALADVRDIVHVSRRIGSSGRVVMAADVAAHRFLAAHAEASELAAFVASLLGPLFEHDARHATELMRTLDVHFTAGRRKATTASHLGIRRQTLYGRLERIEQLLGLRLDDPDMATTLGMAIIAWRLRTGVPARTVDR